MKLIYLNSLGRATLSIVLTAVFSITSFAADSKISLCEALLSRARSMIQSLPFDKVKGVDDLKEYEGEPLQYRRLFLNESIRQKLQKELGKVSLNDQPLKGFELYLNARLSNYPSWVVRRIEKIIQNAVFYDKRILKNE